jgi:hypothetical protein
LLRKLGRTYNGSKRKRGGGTYAYYVFMDKKVIIKQEDISTAAEKLVVALGW